MQKHGPNNPKSKLLQLFCRHKYGWYKPQTLFFNLSGETQYKVCEKCGKVGGKVFVPNADE